MGAGGMEMCVVAWSTEFAVRAHRAHTEVVIRYVEVSGLDRGLSLLVASQEPFDGSRSMGVIRPVA